jgi:5-(carboxyamino)imidazole ribonucleotide mutase
MRPSDEEFDELAVPVGTLSIGPSGARNAGLMAVRILALDQPELAEKLRAFHERENARVRAEELP